jgi:N6-adenosine-specific RNA methylase IME4
MEAGGGQTKRGADRHYPLMSTRDICTLPVRSWAAANAHLYLWVTNNFLEDGLKVVKAWGFEYITLISWFKEGNPGLGQYFRGLTEHVLFAKRGQPPYRTREDGKRAQGLTGFTAPRTEHSVKPDQIHKWAELLSPEPRLEMFARRARPGWDLWGNEAPLTLEEIFA